jgi:phosphoserine phosphatase
MRLAAGHSVLDLDGTLHPSTLGILLLQDLIAAGQCSTAEGDRLLSGFSSLTKEEMYEPATMARTYQHYAAALKGVPVEVVRQQAEQVWQREKARMFDFVRPLLKLLREHRQEVLLISGSPEPVVRAVGVSLGITSFHGSVFGVTHGVYSGSVVDSPILGAGKARWAEIRPPTIAVGNSVAELPLLEVARHPFPFEPDIALTAEANRRGWPIACRDSLLELVRSALDRTGDRS